MKKAAIALITAILFFSGVILIMVKTMPYFVPSRYGEGNLFFADAEKISSIIIKNDTQKIKLRKIDGSWYCNGYYAKNSLLDDYIKRLSQTTIVSDYQGVTAEETNYEFVTTDNHKLYISVMASDKEDQSIIKTDTKKYILSRDILLPRDLSEYFVQPLLFLQGRKIEQQVGIKGDISLFSSIVYLGAIKKLSDNNGEYKSFALISDDGIKFVCGLYKDKENYFMTINLKTTIMPTVEANEYVKENGFRYEGWYFIIYPEDGNRLWKQLSTK